ncbi:hypothetical protein ACFLYR_09010, partial [Chloroflexota bacterium]
MMGFTSLRESEIVDKALVGCSVVAGLDAYCDLLDERRYLDYSAIMDKAVYELTNNNDLRGRRWR